jgi:hypothetical protein
MTFIKKAILHPFLMAIYPVFALVVFNLNQMDPWNALRSLVVSFIMTILLFIVFWPVFKNPYKAGILVTFFLVLFYTYGHVYTIIEDRRLFGLNIGRHRELLMVWLGLLGLSIWWVRRRKGELYGMNQGLNIITVVLMVFPTVQLITYEARSVMTARGANSPAGVNGIQLQLSSTQTNGEKSSPDIYYIILDGYTRGDTLEQYFHYDNTPFLEKLTGMGFYVAECSQSNYSLTMFSLTSSLNLSYLDELAPDFTALKNGPEIDHNLMLNSKVIQSLRRIGYKIVALESGYTPTELKSADTFLSYSSGPGKYDFFREINPFEALLLRTTLGLLMYEAKPRLPDKVQNFLDSTYARHRDRILFSLEELPKIPDLPGHKFVFAHIVSPHKPFVFGPEGQLLEQRTPFTLKEETKIDDREEYIRGYRWQVEYLNKRLEPILKQIIANSKTPPIIIIQGDHGPVVNKTSPSARMTILNAYYLPGEGEKELYPWISPVNSFRVIFDHYYGGKLDLLDDLSTYYDFRSNTLDLLPYDRTTCKVKE